MRTKARCPGGDAAIIRILSRRVHGGLTVRSRIPTCSMDAKGTPIIHLAACEQPGGSHLSSGSRSGLEVSECAGSGHHRAATGVPSLAQGVGGFLAAGMVHNHHKNEEEKRVCFL